MIVKMTSKGKLTLPPAPRKALGDSIVNIELRIGSLPDMSGCLSKFAKNPAEPLSLSEIRKKVRSEVAHDKASKMSEQ